MQENITLDTILELRLPKALEDNNIATEEEITITNKLEDEIEYTWHLEIDNKKYQFSYYKKSKEVVLESMPPATIGSRKNK